MHVQSVQKINTVFHCQICKFVGFLLPLSSWLLMLPNGPRALWLAWHEWFSCKRHWRVKDLLVRARAVVRTPYMKIFLCRLVDYVKKLHQKMCRTCSTIIFLLRSTNQNTDLWRFRGRCRHHVLNSLKRNFSQDRQRRQKSMIWLVEWGQIIVLHVQQRTYRILWRSLSNVKVKFPNKVLTTTWSPKTKFFIHYIKF